MRDAVGILALQGGEDVNCVHWQALALGLGLVVVVWQIVWGHPR